MYGDRGNRLRNWAKDLGGLALYYPGQLVMSGLPRRLLDPTARVGGAVARGLAGNGDQMRAELRALWGNRQLPRAEDDIIADAFRMAMFNELEVLRYPRLSPTTIDSVCGLEGRHHLDQGLSRGNGVIVLIGHFGANQMIMPALGHNGYQVNQLSAPPTVWADILKDSRNTPMWGRVLARRWALEQTLPVRHIDVFKFLRPAFRCLQDNQVLGLAFDGGGGNRWTQVSFLGRTANISTQAFELWAKTKATLLPTIVLRPCGQARHRVVIGEPMVWSEQCPATQQLQANAQAYVDWFCQWVQRHPSHYLQFLAMRRRVASSDRQPMFNDYPVYQ